MKHILFLFNKPLSIPQSPVCKAFGVLVAATNREIGYNDAQDILVQQLAFTEWRNQSYEARCWGRKNGKQLEEDRYYICGEEEYELEYDEIPWTFLSKNGKIYKTGRGEARWDVPEEFVESLDVSDSNFLMMEYKGGLAKISDFKCIDNTLFLTNFKSYTKLLNKIGKPDWKVVKNPEYEKGKLPF